MHRYEFDTTVFCSIATVREMTCHNVQSEVVKTDHCLETCNNTQSDVVTTEHRCVHTKYTGMYTGASTKQSNTATGTRPSTMNSQPVDKLTQVKPANSRSSNQITRSLHSKRGQNDLTRWTHTGFAMRWKSGWPRHAHTLMCWQAGILVNSFRAITCGKCSRLPHMMQFAVCTVSFWVADVPSS